MVERYIHGHFRTVLDDHGRRTATNSAGFLLPHLAGTDQLLDIGCGPGSITLDLAEIVDSVTGLDAAPAALDRASRDAAARGIANVTFVTGDVYELPFAADSFDVVYAHQVLQHLAHPGAALVEALRVLRPGGILAVRDADYGTMVHDPSQLLMDRWLELYHTLARANGGEPDAGRRLGGWVRRAGFTAVTQSTSTWTYTTPDAVAGWCRLWTSRLREAGIGRALLELELATEDEIEAIAGAFEDWAAAEQPFFAFLHGEVLARKPS